MTPLANQLTRKNLATLQSTIAEVKAIRVAELSGVSETILSRMNIATKANNGDDRSDFERFCAIAAACNLVLVPRTFTSVDPDHLRALAALARAGIDTVEAQDMGVGEL